MFIAFFALIVLAGCATTNVETTGSPLGKPICLSEKPAVKTLVLWGTQWRSDQKEPQLREAAAYRGIQNFLAAAYRGIQNFLERVSCIAVTGVQKLSWGEHPPSNEDLLHIASSSKPKPELLWLFESLGHASSLGARISLKGVPR